METRHKEGLASLEREQQFDALLCIVSTIQVLQIGATKAKKEHYPAAPKKKPTDEEIKQRAHHIFLERGGTQGSDVEDWLQAERELLSGARKDHPQSEKV